MSSRLTTCVAFVVLLGTLTACGDDSPDGSAAPTAPASSSTSTPTAVGTTTTEPTASASATSAPTATADDCAGKVVPDGTWTGPITMDVRGNGGQSGFADSRGTGRLTLTVKDAEVTGGTWTLTWKSHGEANTGQAAATVDLTGTVTGTAKGTAAKPVLTDNWRIKGIATITKPVKNRAPFNETGTGSETLTITSSACDRVTGTFVPSFNSKEAAATFTGKAEWIGSLSRS